MSGEYERHQDESDGFYLSTTPDGTPYVTNVPNDMEYTLPTAATIEATCEAAGIQRMPGPCVACSRCTELQIERDGMVEQNKHLLHWIEFQYKTFSGEPLSPTSDLTGVLHLNFLDYTRVIETQLSVMTAERDQARKWAKAWKDVAHNNRSMYRRQTERLAERGESNNALIASLFERDQLQARLNAIREILDELTPDTLQPEVDTVQATREAVDHCKETASEWATCQARIGAMLAEIESVREVQFEDDDGDMLIAASNLDNIRDAGATPPASSSISIEEEWARR